MKKKKILYIITKSNWGGAGRYVYDMATHIPKDTFDIKVVLGGNGVVKTKLEEAHISTVTMNILQRDVNILKDFYVCIALIKLFQKEQPDIIHLNSSKIGALGGVAGRIHILIQKFKQKKLQTSTKIIFTAHGWAHTEKFRPRWQRNLIAILHWITIVLSHKTIAVSEGSKNEVADFPLVQNKITVVHNGIQKPLFLDKITAQKELLHSTLHTQPNTKKIWIGTIAELHKNKGLSYLIEAFATLQNSTNNKSLQNTILIIIGDGEEKESLIYLAKKLQVDKNIYFITKEGNANSYLKAFDIFVLPSIKEGLPYAILEAGIAELPIISSNIGGIPEVVINNKNGILTEPGSAHSLTGALKYLLQNPGIMSDFSTNIKEKVTRDFSLNKMISNTINVY